MSKFDTALTFGSVSLPWHAIILVLAVVAGVAVMSVVVRRRGLFRDLALDLCILCIPTGLVGARLFSALSQKISWSELFSIGQTGLNLYGALLFCFAGTAIYCKVRKFSFGETLDAAAPGILTAIAVGRWQDFFLCDGLGYPVEKTVCKFFPVATVTEAYFQDGVSVAYAVFFWESLFCFAFAAFTLFFLLQRELRDGDAFAIAMLLFGTFGYFFEIARDPAYRQIIVFDIPFNGLLSALIALAAFGYLLFGKRFGEIRKGIRKLRGAAAAAAEGEITEENTMEEKTNG